MSPNIKDRHLLGVGAAACAVCCAPPLLALLGLAGAGLAATIVTLAFAGLAFGAIVLAGALFAVCAGRRAVANACAPDTRFDGPVTGPVDVAIGARPTDASADPRSAR